MLSLNYKVVMETEMLEIIVKVLKGEAIPEEKQKLIKWLGQDQHNMDIFKQSESIWNALEIINNRKEFDSEMAFNSFKQKIDKSLIKSGRLRFSRTVDRLLRIAAVIVIVSGISYFLLMRSEKESFVSGLSSSEVIVPRGSKTQLLLPDGTKVWLNSDSKINYKNDFNTDLRQIYLEGEGYFEVTNYHNKPFIVSTSDIIVRALGTSFNIKSYPGEGIIETTLIEGKVEIESKIPGNGSKIVSLDPNQKAVFYKGIGPEPIQNNTRNDNKNRGISSVNTNLQLTVLSEKVDAQLMILWKNDILYFENERFQDLAVKLERRFGVTLHFLDEDIKQLHFSGKFKDIIIEQVLAALQFASPFYYTINDKDISISNKPITNNNLKSEPS